MIVEDEESPRFSERMIKEETRMFEKALFPPEMS